MRRRRKRRSARTRHGLQHIGDLLPKLLAEIEDHHDFENESQNDHAGLPTNKSARSKLTFALVSIPLTEDEKQPTFAFYQSNEI